MDFTLYYRGELKANRGPRDKHKLRQHFHEQLKELWEQPPLKNMQKYLDPEYRDAFAEEDAEPQTVSTRVDGHAFASVVCSTFNLIADLSITLLRPEPPGQIITQAGDIDNRLKTLLDALKVPDHNALPKNFSPSEDETPFFCLLEDDNLIAGLNITTDRLLVPEAGNSEVVLLIHVRTKPTRFTITNLSLA